MSDKQHNVVVSGRSCTTQMLKVVDKITEMLDQRGFVDMVYVNFAKAFDTVPHRRINSVMPNPIFVLHQRFATGNNIILVHVCR